MQKQRSEPFGRSFVVWFRAALIAGLEFVDVVLDAVGALEHQHQVGVDELEVLLVVHLLVVGEVLVLLAHYLVDVDSVVTLGDVDLLVGLGTADAANHTLVAHAAVHAEAERGVVLDLDTHGLSRALDALGLLLVLCHELVAGLVGADARSDVVVYVLVGDRHILVVGVVDCHRVHCRVCGVA